MASLFEYQRRRYRAVRETFTGSGRQRTAPGGCIARGATGDVEAQAMELTVLLGRFHCRESGGNFRIVESPVSLKKDWVLTQDAFKVLLACLDPDQERAGEKYENIRRGLITFFECRGCFSPEDHADDTINRVARRLAEGKEIYAENPASYFYGVARNVLREHWESAHPAPAPLENLPPSKDLSNDPGELDARQLERLQREQQLECLEHCLRELFRETELITDYYQGETAVKIKYRKSLAQTQHSTERAKNPGAADSGKLEECCAAVEAVGGCAMKDLTNEKAAGPVPARGACPEEQSQLERISPILKFAGAPGPRAI
jgi:DNA-directed RNA polymerase specialized sigma24 family protein